MSTPPTPFRRSLVSSLEILESRIAPAFAAVLELAALNGLNGFQLNGEEARDYAGFSVSDAGDVNGDGFDDLLIGAPGAVPGGPDSDDVRTGIAYVVFGRAAAFASVFELSSINGVNGFRIHGEGLEDASGGAVSAAGDVNGDGFDDLLIGAPGAAPNGSGSGASYVVFGHGGIFADTLELSSLNGVTGFQMNGEGGDVGSGVAVTAAGDVNGDGFDDVLIGAPYTGANAQAAGTSYLVFGHSGAFSATLELGGLNGTDGFRINGELFGDNSGFAVSGAGDINGDGFDDLLLGAPYADRHLDGDDGGASYVVFGHGGAFAAEIELRSLTGANGFQILGDAPYSQSGRAVSGAGDINGDGFDDLLIGAPSDNREGPDAGVSFVIFGRGEVFPAVFALASLDGANGFRIFGEPGDEQFSGDESGHAVSGAGDVNGDGFDDLLIGAPGANESGTNSGASYVVYGRGGAFSPTLALASLNGINGFKIRGEGCYDSSGSSVSTAGDVNGDGFDDLLIGAPSAPNGTFVGASYVIFGSAPLTPIISANGQRAIFTDVDGDRVIVRTDRGTFDAANFTITAVPGAVTGGGQFARLDVSDAEFAGANLSIIARRTAAGGDGLVNLGFLDAAGIDLGRVSIEGDLARVNAGDANRLTPALSSLAVQSMGIFGESTQLGLAPSLASRLVGGATQLQIAGDVRGSDLAVAADDVRLLKIGGDLTGATFSGGSFGRVKVGGSIDGGAIELLGRLAALQVGDDLDDARIIAPGGIGRIVAAATPRAYELTGGITVAGSIRDSSIGTDGDLAQLTVGGRLEASTISARGELHPLDVLSALTIGEIRVAGRVDNVEILAGYNLPGLAVNADVQVGRIVVGADWRAGSLAVGVGRGADGDLGTADDALIAGGSARIVARLAALIIEGHAVGTVGGSDHFGIAAEQVSTFRSGGTTLPLTPGAQNDLAGFNVGPTFDFRVREALALA